MNPWRDLRYGVRTLGRTPLFTVTAVLTLAIGIAAATTIFTVADDVLLRPLAYDEPERIVGFWAGGSWSRAELQFMRETARSYEHVAAFATRDLVLTGLEEPVAVSAATVSSNLLRVLGVAPVLGRDFLLDEERPGKDRVVILGHALWNGVFGADPDVVGRTTLIDDTPFEVIGVMPAGFKFPDANALLWIPITMDPAAAEYRRGHFLNLVGRLGSTVTLAEARAEIAALVPLLTEAFDLKEGFGELATPATVLSFRDQIVGEVRPAMLLLVAAVVLVLLIVCANVANLLMARSVRRRREMAIRTALGAGRGSLVGQLMIESVLLAVLGGGIGMLLALWGVDLTVTHLPPESPRLEEIGIDFRAFGFCSGVALLTAFLFGLVPAVQTSRTDPQPLLAEGRGSSGAPKHRVRRFIVGAEVAVAVVLLVAAGLMSRTLLELNGVDPGFSSNGVLTMRVNLATSDYGDNQRRVHFYEEAIRRVGALPGVEAAGANWRLPIAARGAYQILEVDGRPAAPGEPVPFVYWRTVAGDYFRSMGIRLVTGRPLGAEDRSDALPVCLVNESMAGHYWPEGNAVGQRIRNSMEGDQWLTIVGVVGDVRHNGLSSPSEFMMYRPYAQTAWISPGLSLTIRTQGDPAAVARAVGATLREIEPKVATLRVLTMDQIVAASIARTRMTTALIVLFGAVALVLSAIGLFATLSFSVSQRTREMGIRIALGATPRELLRQIVAEGMIPALAGGALGVIGAFALTRLMAALLFGVSPTDPVVFIGVAALLVSVAAAACYLPARRASRIDPMVTLRYE